jgi:hypothetical protein
VPVVTDRESKTHRGAIVLIVLQPSSAYREGMRKLFGIGAIVLAVAVAVGAVALTDDDPLEVIQLQGSPAEPTPRASDADDRPLSPDEERRAREAALEVTGGGEVVEFDRSDDPGEAYEVEVFKDGREHDVALDLDFEPVPNRRYED